MLKILSRGKRVKSICHRIHRKISRLPRSEAAVSTTGARRMPEGKSQNSKVQFKIKN